MTPSWYDVLDIEPTATPAEVRAAWRAAIDDLDPTDRRFKLRNTAAEVLLDPEKRAAHDADLEGEDAGTSDPADHPGADPGAGPAGVRTSEATTSRRTRSPRAKRMPTSAVPPERTWRVAQARAATTAAGGTTPATSSNRTARPRPLVVLPAVLAVVAVVLLVVSVLAHVRGSDGRPLPSDQEIARAQAAAETAVVPIVAYDYRNLEENKAAAESFMTPRYRDLYDQYFAAAVEGNAERTQTVVEVQLISSGIVRTGPGQVDVLAFINRPSSNIEQTRVFRDQVVLRMVDRDDQWLVDCLITTAGGSCGT